MTPPCRPTNIRCVPWDLKSTEKASELNMIAERHLESNDPNLSNLESSGIKRHGMSRHLPAPPRSLLLALSECPCMHDRCTRAPLAVCARTARCRLAAAPDIRGFAGVGDAERDALCADGLRVSALSMRGQGMRMRRACSNQGCRTLHLLYTLERACMQRQT